MGAFSLIVVINLLNRFSVVNLGQAFALQLILNVLVS